MTESRGRSKTSSTWAVGASVFAATLMILAGVFQFLQGLVAIVDGDEFLVVTPDYLFKFDATTWGWIHLLLGLVLVAAGGFILTGNVLARGIGILIAAVSAVASFLWIPYYPVWSLLIIALDVFIIWGLNRGNLGET